MTRKNIVVAPCGNKSFLFDEKWLNKPDERNFDLCLLFYHENINDRKRYESAEYFFHLKDFKYIMIHNLLTTISPDILDKYDYFYFLDDDIDIDTKSINRMFDLSQAFQSMISQASLTEESYCSWPILKHNKKCFVRFMGQIEVMAPLFSRDALRKCLSSFIVNKSSWGIDSAWSGILENPSKKIMVFDEVQMAHTLPVGGGELYTKIQVDPHDDWDHAVNTYGAIKNNYIELGRLLKVDEDYNKSIRLRVRAVGFLNRIKQRINDLGIGWRIRNKLSLPQK